MYNRLFTKILDSSIWLEADATRIVWITLLAAMDEDGFAPFSCNDNLARRANVPKEALSEALKTLESPDKYNPNDEFEGRRIERVPNGWMVLKAPYYRNLLSREIAREQNRVRVKRFREKTDVMNESLQNITVMQQSRAEQSTSKAETIYCAYPKKKGREEALKAISKALKKTPFDDLLSKTQAFARVRPSPSDKFTPLPATWFNQGRYNDDPLTWPDGEDLGRTKPKTGAQERLDRDYDEARKEYGQTSR